MSKNLALDMVGAAVSHYTKFERPIDKIYLSPKYWDMWKSGILERKPELEPDLNEFNEMQFSMKIGKNQFYFTVKKGSFLMTKTMDVILKQRVLA